MTSANTSSIPVIDYFNDEVFYKILDLNQTDKDQIFEMLTKYVDVLYKILDPGNHPILDHIKGQPWATVEAISATEADTSGVDYDKPKRLIDEYDAWKAKQ